MFEWMKSTRSIIAVLAMLLVYVVVIGTILGAIFPNEILMLVGGTVGVITAYFGKRDAPEEQAGSSTTTTTVTPEAPTVTTTINPTKQKK